jgi:hypothetical protein
MASTFACSHPPFSKRSIKQENCKQIAQEKTLMISCINSQIGIRKVDIDSEKQQKRLAS